jgi:hypothetical protein
MPNWVRNVVKMKGVGKLPLYSTCSDGEEYFDFEKLIPMPESLNLDSGSIETLAIQCFKAKIMKCCRHPSLSNWQYAWGGLVIMPDKELADMAKEIGKSITELEFLGHQYIENIVRYGATTWYDWRINHWGTKWNSSNLRRIDNDTIAFDTAWSDPEPILIELGARYPDAVIEHWWADEEIGNNAGYRWMNGETVDTQQSACDQEAFGIYIKCWGETNCLYRDENGELVRRDCDDCPGC